MAILNFTLQGKGGVGKSMVSSFLAQHLIQNGITPICFDTDPVNPTFSRYRQIGARHVNVMDGSEINPRYFDQLIESLLALSEDDHAIIDNGAASFVPLCSYLVENGVVPFLIEQGHQIRLHTVVIGSQGFKDTMSGLDALIQYFPDVPVIVWKNAYFGAVLSNGKPVEETTYFQKHKSRIFGIVTLAAVKKETFGKDLEELFGKHKTFAEGQDDSEISIMARQRLKMFWGNTTSSMIAAGL